MSRIPKAELERLKREVSLSELVGSRIRLERRGKDLVGRCPFHDDDTASFVVTEHKGLWHCFGCHAGGTAIDWVMKMDGLAFRDAADRLRAQLSPAEVVSVPFGYSRTMTDGELMSTVADTYHAQLMKTPAALHYVTETRGLSLEVLKRYRVGFSCRSSTLLSRVPAPERDEAKGRLQALGVVRATGFEHLVRCIVVPLVDEGGAVVSLYGRRAALGTVGNSGPRHLYLPGPHCGFLDAELGEDVSLCESLIDALTFLSHGFRSVASSFGCEGFTEEMLRHFQGRGVKRVRIAYDHDESGDHAADRLAQKLAEVGIASARVLFPKNLDANAYALAMKPVAKALELALRTAKPYGEAAAFATTAPAQEDPEEQPLLAAERLASAELEEPAEQTGESSVEVKSDDEAVVMALGLRFRVRGLSKLSAMDILKVNVLVSLGDAFHVDTFDLYAAKARSHFVGAGAHELGIDPADMKRAVGRLILALERVRDERLLESDDEPEPMSDEEREEALKLLSDPKLTERIQADLEACGLVGEENNKLLAYLAATSRKLSKPLAVMVQSSSAAGKSSLMDAVLSFVPDEEKVQYSALTGQSLFYLGDKDLRHKVLAISEEAGAEQASYALKLLQSEGRLRIASTGKDAASGRHTTHTYEVEGPVAILSTTTALDVDEELLNRCIVLTVDESQDQTRAIHALQKELETLEGLSRRARRESLQRLHQNAQRLLHPVEVVNPLAPDLIFSDARTRSRRDHMKLLGLIRTIAFLHQHQREVKRTAEGIEYIEAQLSDVEAARKLLATMLADVIEELPPQTRVVLGYVEGFVADRAKELGQEPAEVAFSRRELREATGLGDTQLKVHLARLVELELLLARRQSYHQGLRYRLSEAIGRAHPAVGRASVGHRSAPHPDRSSTRKINGNRPGGGDRSATLEPLLPGPNGHAHEPIVMVAAAK